MNNQQHQAHQEQELVLRVEAMRRQSEGVVSVELVSPDEADLPAWSAGAHLDLCLGATTRQYSLCGDPRDRKRWRIAVLREQESRGGSLAVHERVRVGDLVTVVGPRNHFTLPEAQEYLFIAGGIGITPILPMIAEVDRRELPWRLLYGGRSRASMAFTDELAPHGDHVTLCPADECGLLDLGSAIGKVRTAEQATLAICCCGPEPLLKAVEEACTPWPAGTLHLERFSPKVVEPSDEAEQSFELVMAQQQTTITVPAGCSVLEAMEREGFSHVSSCREGICGTCETTVLEGQPDHRDSLLSPEEQEANDTMMICVGRARSSRLVLDL